MRVLFSDCERRYIFFFDLRALSATFSLPLWLALPCKKPAPRNIHGTKPFPSLTVVAALVSLVLVDQPVQLRISAHLRNSASDGLLNPTHDFLWRVFAKAGSTINQHDCMIVRCLTCLVLLFEEVMRDNTKSAALKYDSIEEGVKL